jgi:FkbM family methyltransferase
MLFVPALKQAGLLDGLHVTLVYVGSRKLPEFGETYDHWAAAFAPRLTIFGFDADRAACDRMNAENVARGITWTERHVPVGLWSSAGAHTLHVTQYPGCSSLLRPDPTYMARFSTHQAMMKVVGTATVETTTLDAFCDAEGVAEVDFLQVDVQGGGMHVLRGGERTIDRGVLALVSEADFAQAYEGAAVFGDVDVYLRQRGLTLFDLVGNHHGTRATFPLNSKEHSGPLEWSDAFYFRDLIHPRHADSPLRTPQRILKLACIADCMNFVDYAAELLEHLTVHHGADARYNAARPVLDTLTALPQLTPDLLRQLPIVDTMLKHVGGPYALPPRAPGQPQDVYTITGGIGSGNVIR